MSSSPGNRFGPDLQSSDLTVTGEDTLRLIASLPAPEGLADRVQNGLRHAPPTARVLDWRNPLRPSGGWMQSTMARGAAAAAIVCVVAGGGWRIYSRVQPVPAAKVVAIPPRVTPGRNGFSQAGAKRVPQTLDGPVLTHTAAGNTEQKVVDKTPSPSRPAPGRPTAAKKSAARPSAARPSAARPVAIPMP
jgi:hypothetical protein